MTKLEVVLESEEDLSHEVQKGLVDKIYGFATGEGLAVKILRVTT